MTKEISLRLKRLTLANQEHGSRSNESRITEQRESDHGATRARITEQREGGSFAGNFRCLDTEVVCGVKRQIDLKQLPYSIRSASLNGSKTPFWSLLLSYPASDTARILTSTLPAMSARFAIAFHAL